MLDDLLSTTMWRVTITRDVPFRWLQDSQQHFAMEKTKRSKKVCWLKVYFNWLFIDDEIVIRSWADKEFKVATRVVKIIEEFDTIILRSEGVDICDRNFISESTVPRKGMHYLMVIFYQIKYFLNCFSKNTFLDGILDSSWKNKSSIAFKRNNRKWCDSKSVLYRFVGYRFTSIGYLQERVDHSKETAVVVVGT